MTQNLGYRKNFIYYFKLKIFELRLGCEIMNILNSLKEDLNKIKENKPLIHHMTNQVVMNDSANITIGIGASPVMSHSKKEVEEMVSISSSLLLNIGTLDNNYMKSMLLAGKKATEMNKPIILDPVGAGATEYRTKSAKKILDNTNISIIKGNAGEISALHGLTGKVKGVESDVQNKEGIEEMAKELSKKYKATVTVTGKTDIVTNENKTKKIDNGVEMLGDITGSGCMLGSIIASFIAVNNNPFLASLEGLISYEISAETSSKNSDGPGDFRKNLLNEIFNLKIGNIKENIKIR